MFRQAAVVLASALLVAGCSSGQQAAQDRQGQTGFVSGSGRVSTFAPAERKAAPAFGGTTLDGKQWKLADAAGKVVVMNVWGSWCGPCREEAPDFTAAAKELGSGVQFIGLNTRDMQTAAPKKFVEVFGVDYPSIYDPYGKELLKFRGQKLSPSAVPATLVIDKQGKVAARVLGPVNKETLVAMVKDAG
ncbi:TlpA family protein disulfide reductase [Kribbella sandramycini]|nr:TlpA family protein disulfide reductase [Kribbella sandramycini]